VCKQHCNIIHLVSSHYTATLNVKFFAFVSKALFLLKCRTHIVQRSFDDDIIEAHTRHLW